MLELVALGTDTATATAVGARLGGTVYVNHPGESDARPFSAVVRVATDEIEAVASVADVGLYVAYTRPVKVLAGPAPADRVIAAFGMVGHPDLTHRESDDHWRDVHGPLALRMHAAMCDYTQLSVVAVLSGLPLDGIALCAFSSRDDLSTKFFNDDEAKAAIQADVASFADLRRSIRRVVVTEV